MLNSVSLTESVAIGDMVDDVEALNAPVFECESLEPSFAAMPAGEKLDRAGATASFVCAIHCALMPFIITVLPLLGLGFLSSEPVEWALLSASAVLGTLSLCVGFREHRKRRVFGVLGLALAFLVAGRILHEQHLGWWGPIFMVLGGFTMMSAHLFNRILCRSCQNCSAQNCCA